ncbi:type-1 fimbrial protein subunit A [Burkholderia lata]|uniref:fimbrial protein n=1 Tax=Burkholderia lata (strain ATCC 17760 / DSM 23089 / LMG 22485 / NCIMB 9086 / R18194 / 383) TaxID=482957 RepID=UPI001454141B|nr:fimbrial protein [Burkholderia lata]VWD61787.1 type-1 fimbrial protein subunit A [Burkholderia lata]
MKPTTSRFAARLRRWAALAALTLGTAPAFATCLSAPEDFNPIEFGPMAADGVEPGGVIRSVRFTLTITCSRNGQNQPEPRMLQYSSEFRAQPGMNLWASNLPGLALRMARDGEDLGGNTDGLLGVHPGDGTAREYVIDMDLVKTGPVTPGFLQGQVLSVDASAAIGDPAHNVVHKHITSSYVRGVACTVNTDSKHLVVPLGAVPATAFDGPGSARASREFSINLTCSPYGEARPTPLSIQLLGETVPGAADVLKLQGDDAAQGIGIRVLKDEAPVALNAWHSLGDATVGATALPFTAQYYQYGERVTAGSGDGVMTFLIEMR